MGGEVVDLRAVGVTAGLGSVGEDAWSERAGWVGGVGRVAWAFVFFPTQRSFYVSVDYVSVSQLTSACR